MGPVSLKVRYRPLRIGWCIDAENRDDFLAAVGLSHVFWGGRYFPIIPCASQELSRAIIRAFHVDALYNVSGTPAVDAFIADFPHLRWPDYHPELFADTGGQKLATLLDVAHPAQHLFEAHVDRRDKPRIEAGLYQWQDGDPLGLVLAATCGFYPPEAVTGRDYAQIFARAFAVTPTPITPAQALPEELFRRFTPNHLTTVDLEEAPPYSFGSREEPGFYYGNAADLTDLLNFWNLRACDVDLLFYDPAQGDRLQLLIAAYAAWLRQRPRRATSFPDIAVWKKDRDVPGDLGIFGERVSLSPFDPIIFNGLNLNPSVMTFAAKSVLGASLEDSLGTGVAFQLPEKPFFADADLYVQKVVVSVAGPNIGNAMLTPPFVPQLNAYYGRTAYFRGSAARSEPGGLGIIINVTDEQLTLHALPFPELVSNIFETYGIKAKLSPAGLVTTRLLAQMGGLQGCRVFKIAGVRSLIKKYAPDQSFERTEAITMIGDLDPAAHQPRFDAYKLLYIEQRDKPELKPEDAFLYLLKKGVFRAGLKLACPTCQLDFWASLDDAHTTTQCVYCGFGFNVLPQLRDRNWAYRRSGLFGRDDHQRGGIPVAVTLQQLDTMLQHRELLAYLPGMQLTPSTDPMEECEADFVLLATGSPRSGRPLTLVIGECKDVGGEIAEEDVRKLTAVARALHNGPWEVFVLFAKCGEFTPAEIEHCKAGRRKLFEHAGKTIYLQDIIMLSRRELEPYTLYEETQKEFEVQVYAHVFDDLARNTNNIYFEPKRKAQA
jgi:hypothetical protein